MVAREKRIEQVKCLKKQKKQEITKHFKSKEKKKKEVNKDFFFKRKMFAFEYEMEKNLGITPVNLIETFKQRRKMAITSFWTNINSQDLRD